MDLRVRFAVDDQALSDLHSRAFGYAAPSVVSWSQRLQRHSLTWIGAFDRGSLVGFVHGCWDGGSHAFALDTAGPHHPGTCAVTPRPAAARKDPVADAVRDRRPRQRDPGPQRRGPRPRRPPRARQIQRRRHRMDLLGLRHGAPAPETASRPRGRAGVPLRTPAVACPTTQRPRPLPEHRSGPARLRPSARAVHRPHRMGSCTNCATRPPPSSASKAYRYS